MGVAATVAVLVFAGGFLLVVRRTEQSTVQEYIVASAKGPPEDSLAPALIANRFESEMVQTYLIGVFAGLLIGGILGYTLW